MSSPVKAAPKQQPKTPSKATAKEATAAPAKPAGKGSAGPDTAPALLKVTDAWCTLATAVNGSRTVGELLGKAGLKGWDVRPEPAFAEVPSGVCSECSKAIGQKHAAGCFLGEAEPGEESDGKVDENDTLQPVEIPNCYALVRTDPKTGRPDAIGSSARQVTPVSIEKRISILAEIAKQTNAKCGPAGPLWNNTAGFASVKLPELIKVGKAAELELRVILVNSLVPGKPSQIWFSAVRPASGTVQHFPLEKLTLTSSDDESTRQTEASDAIAAAQAAADQVGELASKMRAKRMTEAEFDKVCAELFKAPSDAANTWLKEQYARQRAVLRMLFNGKVDLVAGIGQTRWSAWQAIQTVAEHMPHVELKTDEDPDETRRYRAEQTLFGRVAALSTEAYKLLAV